MNSFEYGSARRAVAFVLGLGFACVSAAPAETQTIVVDETAPETVFDAVLDGFPGLASFDGVGDFGGNAIGVALKSETTEERAIMEFPLVGLASYASAEVESATLTFNIDDVLSTFGPGTEFDGTASETIYIHVYGGDGVVDVTDYQEGDGTPLISLDTAANGNGTITDASIRDVTGPVVFDVDITGALRAELDAFSDFLGVVWSTDDDQSGTSIDNLGNGAAGPEGVNGSFMPFLTIVISEGSTTTTTIGAATTTTTSTTTSTMPAAGACGDANADTAVNASDALIILRSSVGVGQCGLAICDVDGTGTVTAGDALRVLRFSVGLDSQLFCG